MTSGDAPIRVMQMVAKFEYGGAQRVIRDIIACSDPGRFQYQVCGMLNDHAAREWVEDLGVQFVSADFSSLVSPGSYSRIIRLIRQFEPHVLHCHTQAADVIAWALRGRLGNPGMLATIHNMAEFYYDNQRQWLRRCEARMHKVAMNRWPGTVVSIGPAIKQSFAPHIRLWEQMPVIENGIDESRLMAQSQRSREQVRQEFGIEPDTVVFLSAGRLTNQKRYDILVHTIAELDHPELRFVSLIAGTGPLQADIEKMIEQQGLGHRIRMLGVRDDVVDLMNAADCFLMTSEVEGLPMALLEAMMLGLPTVSTAVGAIPDVIEDGLTGRLSPPQDAAAIAAAMREIILDPAQARAWGEQARETARTRYSAANMARNYEELYESLARPGA